MKDLSKKAQVGKKISMKKLIKKCDKACSDGVLHIDGGETWDNPALKGFFCNNHLIRRGCHKVRFHPLNCFCGTSGANFRHENHPEYMNAWFAHKYGADVYYQLQRYSVGEAKWTRDELERIIDFWNRVTDLPMVEDIHYQRDFIIDNYMKLFRTSDQSELIKAFNDWNLKKTK